jgi:hypothetical protein
MKHATALLLLFFATTTGVFSAPTVKDSEVVKRLAAKGISQLENPPDLPYMPPYPNALYQSITSRPNDKDGPGFAMTFHTNSTASDVLNFYKDAFKRNNWVMMAGANAVSMSAMRKGTIFDVACLRPYVKGYATQVTIGYKIFSKQRNEEQ